MGQHTVQKRVVGIIRKYLTVACEFFKKNYRNYYDDRSWWDEVGNRRKP